MNSRSGSCETEAYVFLISLFRSSTSIATSTAIPASSLVAEDRRHVVADPLEERRRTTDPGVGDEVLLVEPARVEAVRAGDQLTAAVRVLLEEPLERRAAVTGHALGDVREGEPHRVLSQEHHRRLALSDRGSRDQECDHHPLFVIEPGRQVDYDFACHF